MLAPVAFQSYNNFERSTGKDGDLVIPNGGQVFLNAGTVYNYNSITLGQDATLYIVSTPDTYDIPSIVTKLLVKKTITCTGTGGYISVSGGLWVADGSIIVDKDKYGNAFVADIGSQRSGGRSPKETTAPPPMLTGAFGHGAGGDEWTWGVGRRDAPAGTKEKAGGVFGGVPGQSAFNGGGGGRGLHGVPLLVSCQKVVGTLFFDNGGPSGKGGNGGSYCPGTSHGANQGYGCHPDGPDIGLQMGGGGGAGGNAADVYVIQYEGAVDSTGAVSGGFGGLKGHCIPSLATNYDIAEDGQVGENGSHTVIRPTGAPTGRTVRLH